MAHSQPKPLLTEAEYLAFEERSPVRHELVGGETHAMAGASERHNLIAGNIYIRLRSKAKDHGCRTFMADMRLRVAEGQLYYYPDVMLVCSESDQHPMHKEHPCFIAEVLSPATAKIDQREKLQTYLALPSLHYYLVVDADRVWAKVWFRDADGRWLEQELSTHLGVEVRCGETRCLLELDDLYDGTDLPVR